MLRYAITDRTLFDPRAASQDKAASRPSSARCCEALVEQCASLARQGIDILLIREKDLTAGTLIDLCRRIAVAVRVPSPHIRVLVSSRVDIALAASLDGVHLASHAAELTPAQVRSLFPNAFISLSCHTLAQVQAARAAPLENQPDAILFAPIFGKTLRGSAITPAIGLPALTEACRAATPIPVFALGGITEQNAPSCLAAGAAGIAAIRLFMTR